MDNKKVIINFCPTGMLPMKEMCPKVPLQPEEIIEDIIIAKWMGASMIHVHARDEVGKPSFDKGTYQKIIEGVRAVDKDLIMCASTSGRVFNSFLARSECLEAGPDMASLTLSSLNFNKQESVNSPEMIISLAKRMMKLGIKPELEVFDVGMINFAKYLIKKGFLDPPYYFNFILGNIASAQADIFDLGSMINKLPAHSVWSVGAVGTDQFKMNLTSILNGGGVRIGLEDNIWMDEGRTVSADNSSLLLRLRDVMDLIGVEPATPQEVRKCLQI